jgi:hypothetical protein
VTLAKDALSHGKPAFRHIEELIAILLLVHVSRLPDAVGATLPRPPMFAIAIAVDGALARDGDVLLLESINEMIEE